MSDLSINPGGAAHSDVFRIRTVALMLAIGILGFIGTLVMGAFAPDLRSGHNGGTHALSNAAVGFSGIVQLAEATGRNPQIIRSEHQFDSEDLLVVTPDQGFDDVTSILAARSAKPTLFVLPKWATVADPNHTGWVRVADVTVSIDPASLFSPEAEFKIHRVRSGGAGTAGGERRSLDAELDAHMGRSRGADEAQQRQRVGGALLVDEQVAIAGFHRLQAASARSDDAGHAIAIGEGDFQACLFDGLHGAHRQQIVISKNSIRPFF